MKESASVSVHDVNNANVSEQYRLGFYNMTIVSEPVFRFFLFSFTTFLFIALDIHIMNFMKGLFLPKYPNPTIEVGEHVYRHRDAKDGLVREPITPELKDKEYTVYNVWSSVTEQNARKPAFGWRDLIKVSRP